MFIMHCVVHVFVCVCVCVCVLCVVCCVLCVVCVWCDSTGTVVSEDSIAQAVQQFKTSREFKCDKIGNIHLPIGKVHIYYIYNEHYNIVESRSNTNDKQHNNTFFKEK